MSLMENIQDVEVLTERQRALLEELDAIDFEPVVKKAAFEYGLDADRLRNEGVTELRRFYALRILDGAEAPVAIPVALDPLVHVHVLFTQHYREFCERLFGSPFDHWPCTPDDADHMRWLGSVYESTVNRYDRAFVARNTAWWPDPTRDNFSEICCGCCGAG